jgi:HicA toxin of bacterial toxin-antitoxin,
MNSKHTKTLRSIFAHPTPANIEWAAVEALLVAVGCEIVEGSGSRVRFAFKGHVESFHRPHPEKEAWGYQIRQARDFLAQIGVKP